MSSSSSLWLMSAYVVIAFVLQGVAVVAGLIFDRILGGWSTPAFLAVYFLMFWLAWPVALRVTAPRAAKTEP
jgi:hypothetical protein